MRSLLIAVLLVFCLACSTVKTVEVPVEVYSVKTEYIEKLRYDSICVHDSVDRYINGDSVLIYKYRDVLKYKYMTDTVTIVDSIQVPIKIKVETIKEVNHTSKLQDFLMFCGSVALIYVSALIVNAVRRFLKK